jgi:hypothetical protein
MILMGNEKEELKSRRVKSGNKENDSKREEESEE